MFIPDANPTFFACGITDSSGTTSLTTQNKYSGAMAGPHKVQITKEELVDTDETTKNEEGETVAVKTMKSVIPAKYAKVATSELTETVTEGKNSFTIELKD